MYRNGENVVASLVSAGIPESSIQLQTKINTKFFKGVSIQIYGKYNDSQIESIPDAVNIWTNSLVKPPKTLRGSITSSIFRDSDEVIHRLTGKGLLLNISAMLSNG